MFDWIVSNEMATFLGSWASVTLMLVPSTSLFVMAGILLILRRGVPPWERVVFAASIPLSMPLIILNVACSAMFGGSPTGLAMTGIVYLFAGLVLGVLALLPKAFRVEMNPAVMEGKGEAYTRLATSAALSGWSLYVVLVAILYLANSPV